MQNALIAKHKIKNSKQTHTRNVNFKTANSGFSPAKLTVLCKHFSQFHLYQSRQMSRQFNQKATTGHRWIPLKDCELNYFQPNGQPWPRGGLSRQEWENRFTDLFSPRLKYFFDSLWYSLEESYDHRNIWSYLDVFILLTETHFENYYNWGKTIDKMLTFPAQQLWHDLLYIKACYSLTKARSKISDEIWDKMICKAACDFKNSYMWNEPVMEERRQRYIHKYGGNIGHGASVTNKQQVLSQQSVQTMYQVTSGQHNSPHLFVSLLAWTKLNYQQYIPNSFVLCYQFGIIFFDFSWTQRNSVWRYSRQRIGLVENGSLTANHNHLYQLLVSPGVLEQLINNSPRHEFGIQAIQSLHLKFLALVCVCLFVLVYSFSKMVFGVCFCRNIWSKICNLIKFV